MIIIDKIKVLSITVNGEISIKEIHDELCDFQNLVEGYIECLTPIQEDRSIVLICNEEGLLNGSLPNILFPRIHGNILFCSSYGENFTSLNNAQINIIYRFLGLDKNRKR